MDSIAKPSPSMPSYQPSIQRATMAQSPTYPSPARSDPDTMNYTPDGLGLYGYSLPLSTPPAQTISSFYPPSPQPTESWVPPPFTSCTSPRFTEAPTDPWATAYTSTSSVMSPPVTWSQPYSMATSTYLDTRDSPATSDYRLPSHRSSVSSSYEASIYSREGESKCALAPKVKIERQPEWYCPDGCIRLQDQEPLTVSPSRLAAPSAYPYDRRFRSPSLPKFEPCGTRESPRARSGNAGPIRQRRSSSARDRKHGGSRPRSTRNMTTPANANYECQMCGKLFQRSYNHKAHMETHDPAREYPNACSYPGCGRKFVRRTDLVRHDQSVHKGTKEFGCDLCGAHFARKDTLRRHTEDGCPKRFELKAQRTPTSSNNLTVHQPGAFGISNNSPLSPFEFREDGPSPVSRRY